MGRIADSMAQQWLQNASNKRLREQQTQGTIEALKALGQSQPQFEGLINMSPQLGQLLNNPATAQFGSRILGQYLPQQSDYTNVQIEPTTGKAWGLNKSTMTFEPIPTSGAFRQGQMIQGADPTTGIPTQEYVIPSLLDTSSGRVTLSSKPPVPSAEEAQKEAQRAIGIQQLDELERVARRIDLSPERAQLVRERGGVGVFGSLGPILSPGEITQDEATLLSLEQSLSNQLLAAMRGAQVGPKEQERFDKQLPVFGQAPKIFWENVKNTRKNLIELDKIIASLRGRESNTGMKTPPPPPPGYR